LDCLQAAEVPAGPINSVAEVVKEPQFIERDSIQSVPIGENDTLQMAGIVPRLTRTPGTISHVGSSIGADTEAILTELLDASPEGLQSWREAEVI